ncbi:prenyltransferase/squalene oxidase repeat-containing protein [Thalassospira sp.]|uniref:prenyltransferase/squalene oxidase repeat-containing protein n=1 Tax=Thalassospira sp. TaxID=1912094 RepID=UPI0032EE55B4
MDKDQLIDIRDRVLARMKQEGYAGADPFDGLESRLFQASGLGRFRLARLIWLQAIKRGPRALRSLAMIPPSVNPKTLALLHGAGEGVVLGDFTAALSSMQNADGGWGYPFEWQARAFHAKRGQSNAIVTSFVIDGLIRGGMPVDQDVLTGAADFIEGRLWREGYFAYLGHDDCEIHNASLWAAFALSRVRAGNDKTAKAVHRVLEAQHDDGSWAYGTCRHHRFVDGFHTGYILDLLVRLRISGIDGFESAIDRGWSFYRNHCFNNDGIPRTFAGKGGYIDAHAVAQSMASLCRFGDVRGAIKIANWATAHLFDAKRDVFYAGIGRLGPDQQNYMRWTQSWMVWALSIVIEKTAMNDAFDPEKPLSFSHPDPDRTAKEAALAGLSETVFRNLYALTRKEAARVKASGEMDRLYGLTRGMKTLQRIGGQRGIMLGAKRVGFLTGAEIVTPSDFDSMAHDEIAEMFDVKD